jgi:hypothetical protein
VVSGFDLEEDAVISINSRLVRALRARRAEDRCDAAARRLYDAEGALHIARQSRVDSWVAAAYERLHAAILEHNAALAASTASVVSGPPAVGCHRAVSGRRAA